MLVTAIIFLLGVGRIRSINERAESQERTQHQGSHALNGMECGGLVGTLLEKWEWEWMGGRRWMEGGFFAGCRCGWLLARGGCCCCYLSCLSCLSLPFLSLPWLLLLASLAGLPCLPACLLACFAPSLPHARPKKDDDPGY